MDELERVLTLRYGLDGDVPQTLQEVATRLGTTRERVRQLETRALREPPAGVRLRRCKQFEDLLGPYLMEYFSAPLDHPDEPESEAGGGVREPRRPKPSGSSDATALPIPDSNEDA